MSESNFAYDTKNYHMCEICGATSGVFIHRGIPLGALCPEHARKLSVYAAKYAEEVEEATRPVFILTVDKWIDIEKKKYEIDDDTDKPDGIPSS